VQWSPRPAETGVLAGIAVLLAVAVLLVDAAGRVLVGAATLLVLALVLRDLVARPRLAAGPGGVDVRTWSSRRHLPWQGLRVRVREIRRFGLRGRTLELDTAAGPDDDGVLIVLGRRDLGADPEEVARTLLALDPRPRG
jgi:Bacterial PH domain